MKINTEQLIGRRSVTVNRNKLSALVKDKVCLVTGGGGSIGSELCRQIAAAEPKMLVIVDFYENNAYAIQTELSECENISVLIASVQDRRAMENIFKKYRPQLVFHAAAYKHVPLMEYAPDEAVKNNVFGTDNMCALALEYQAERFLLISTDKAVFPSSVMGATKRCCELLIKYYSQRSDKTLFTAVRFGNVLESNGSVIPLFKRQIKRGGPVTVTHPDVTRYFMTIPEAVSLVLEACAMALGGQIFVLDMGQPVNILELAKKLIAASGKEDIEIVFTGLRPGEKLTEELGVDSDKEYATENGHIFIAKSEPLAKDFEKTLACLKQCVTEGGDTVAALKAAVPDFTPDKRIHF